MRRVVLVASSILLLLQSVALAQEAPVSAEEKDGVVVNLDALEDGKAPTPTADTETSSAVVKPKSKPPGSDITRPKLIPVPRPKPVLEPAHATEDAVAAEKSHKPEVPQKVIMAKAPDKPVMPLTIVEDFPVEIRGNATDPFAGKKTVDPSAGFVVVGRVRFGKGASQLPDDAVPGLDAVAQKLAATKERVRLTAFSGPTGDMSSQSRRLSLERAQTVRAYLVSKGIAFDRVDIMPFGGASDGLSDRVDVLASGS